jgi:hypothetical protein
VRKNQVSLTSAKTGQVGAVTGVVIAVAVVIALVAAGILVKRMPAATASSASQELAEAPVEIEHAFVLDVPNTFMEVENPMTMAGGNEVTGLFTVDADECAAAHFT